VRRLTFLPSNHSPPITDLHEVFCRDDPKSCERVERVKTGKKAKKAANQTMLKHNVSPVIGLEQQYQQHGSVCVSPASFEQPQHQQPLDDLEPIGIFDDQDRQENEEDLIMEISRLFPADVTNSGGSAEIPSPYHYFGGESRQKKKELQRLSTNLHSLQALWSNYICSVDADLEPRCIEDMVSKPNRWYRSTPSMTPEQQAIFDFLLPAFLPASFYYLDMSPLAHLFGILLICIHTIECMFTNFGGGAWYRSVLGPLQHVVGDLFLNHLFNSSFLLLGPSLLGTKCNQLILLLIISNTAIAAMAYKIHFEAFILKRMSSGEDTTLGRVLQYKMGRHIRRMFQWYCCVWILLTICFFLVGNTMIQAMAIFVYNLLPFVTDFSYWLEFSKQLRRLPARNRTLLCDRHLNYLVFRDGHVPHKIS
jgi:hypothetical protein